MFNFERQIGSERTTSIIAREAVRQGPEQRRQDIYNSHRHRVFAVAFYMTGSEPEAEKILTRTFVKAFRQSEEPDAPAIDGALVEELGARFPLRETETPAVQTSVAGDDLGGRNVRRTDLEEAVQYLPAAERLIFLLRDVEGYSTEAVARLMGMPVQQASRTLFSARLRLRQILAEGMSRNEAA